MNINVQSLVSQYEKAHDLMRNLDGLQPQDAFDELLKFLYFKENYEDDLTAKTGKKNLLPDGLFSDSELPSPGQIRVLFRRYLKRTNSWSSELWHDASFHLSDVALAGLCRIFKDIRLREIGFDLRSTALKIFLTPDIRRGLGIYLTPDNVVQMMVQVISPHSQERIYDPACGSGTFLIETIKSWNNCRARNRNFEIWGTDKNPRMLLLSELNLGHSPSIEFNRQLLDALFNNPKSGWPVPNSYDVILTNPPFGVILENHNSMLERFSTCASSDGSIKQRQQSEIVFIEQCLRYLKPGGRLGIVLPKSVISNAILRDARTAINRIGYVYAAITLPPETFHTAGTQTTTCILFIQKYKEEENINDKMRIAYAEVTNVGFDSTGRSRADDQLPKVGGDVRMSLTKGEDWGLCRLLPQTPKTSTLSSLSDLITGRTSNTDASSGKKLGDIVELLCTGKTPSRASYCKSGLFLVKVGNLSGQGIDWTPRERNFVKSTAGRTPLLCVDDILLTSSAHSPVYIAKKVDIVTTIPQFVGGKASFVGEVMLIRLKKDSLDPFLLLAYLRSSHTVAQIQRMVRGQTAHLHPDDMKELRIPLALFKVDLTLKQLSQSLRKQAEIASRQNALVNEQTKLIEVLSARW